MSTIRTLERRVKTLERGITGLADLIMTLQRAVDRVLPDDEDTEAPAPPTPAFAVGDRVRGFSPGCGGWEGTIRKIDLGCPIEIEVEGGDGWPWRFRLEPLPPTDPAPTEGGLPIPPEIAATIQEDLARIKAANQPQGSYHYAPDDDWGFPHADQPGCCGNSSQPEPPSPSAALVEWVGKAIQAASPPYVPWGKESELLRDLRFDQAHAAVRATVEGITEPTEGRLERLREALEDASLRSAKWDWEDCVRTILLALRESAGIGEGGDGHGG